MRIALAGQLVVAVLAATLARRLDLVAFEAYAVTAAIFVAMVAIGPFGADRLILLVLPPALAAGDAPRVAALRRFAARRALAGTVAAAAAGAAAGSAMSDDVPGLLPALLLAVLALPWAVIAHLCLEALTAAGQPLAATLALRLAVPAVALAIVLVAAATGEIGAPLAISAWGVGWCLAAVLLLRRTARILPPVAATAAAPVWRSAAWALWLQRATALAMAQLALVALAWLGAPAAEVGAYSVAAMIVGLALVFATSTSRAYAREAALLLDRGDGPGVLALHRRRLRRLSPMLAALLLLAIAFPGPLLSLFRPEFVAVGAPPLRLLAVAAAVSMSLALAPIVLKLRGRHGWLLGAGAGGVAVQLLLLLALVPRHGATGAAVAFLAATSGQYAVLTIAVVLD